MKNIAVIFGGRSAEHDVSIVTAHIPIINTLLADGEFNVLPVYITREGVWYCDQRMNNLSFFQEKTFLETLQSIKPVAISINGSLQIIQSGIFGKSINIDVVFPAMHGTYGEDGSLMGMLRMADVPFVGCDIFASAIAMDKVLTKQIVAQNGMPVVPYIWFEKQDWQSDANAVLDKTKSLKYPLFIKPVHLGSSIGISKANSSQELVNAIEVALQYDNKILVEEGIQPLIEITLPIMGNEILRTAQCERPLNKTDFFDFNDKYMSGGKKGSGVNTQYSEIPAKISPELTSQIIELGKQVYKTLGCGGIARVDFLVHADTRHVYVNEVNTLPGSLYAHNWKRSGVTEHDLVFGLIDLAIKRHEDAKRFSVGFDSDILLHVSGSKIQS